MIYKLAHTAEISSLPFEPTGELYDSLFEFLQVLDNEYGEDRDVEHDNGGYVLFCTPETAAHEIEAILDLRDLAPEWVNRIEHQPEYCAALFMLREDYSIVLIMSTANAPFDTSAMD